MSGRLPALTSKDVVRALERTGFFVHHTTGSHCALRHRDRPELRVTVPLHGKDLKRGTLHAILKQAGLTSEEFLELL